MEQNQRLMVKDVVEARAGDTGEEIIPLMNE